MYKIIRFYKNGKRRVILQGLSLEVAQKHCKSELTHKKDNQGNIIWFDGYIAQ